MVTWEKVFDLLVNILYLDNINAFSPSARPPARPPVRPPARPHAHLPQNLLQICFDTYIKLKKRANG